MSRVAPLCCGGGWRWRVERRFPDFSTVICFILEAVAETAIVSRQPDGLSALIWDDGFSRVGHSRCNSKANHELKVTCGTSRLTVSDRVPVDT